MTSDGMKIAARLNTLADNLQKHIDDKMADKLTNTPKRQLEASYARREGERLKRTQDAMRALAGQHEDGSVSVFLADLKTKKAIYHLMGSKHESSVGYYDAGVDLGTPSIDTEQARELWALLVPKSQEDLDAEKLKKMVDDLQFSKIPRYFPTPEGVQELMFEHFIMHPTVKVLEPSAGSGAIADSLMAYEPMIDLTVVESNHSLAEILNLKGYNPVIGDFMNWNGPNNFDFVVMNPPFEKGQDIDHVMKAYSHLREGGTLVSVMSPGPFFRNDRNAKSFRQWFAMKGGEKYEVPAGAFKESGTGVSSVVVVINA